MRTILIVLLSFLFVPLFAQHTVKVEKTYVYRAESHMSVDQAKIAAVEKAKVAALDSVFGTNILDHKVRVVDIGGGSDVHEYMQIGNSDVRGRWVRDLKDPEFGRIWYEQNLLNVTVTVKGEVREQKSSTILCDVHVLCDGTGKGNEREDFKDGNKMYLSFTAPVDGYLVVYLVDAQMQAFCALPYVNQKDGAYHVEGGKEYVFFSRDKAPVSDIPYVEEYVLDTDKESETNQLYVIFSPNQFTKPVDKFVDPERTRQLSWKDFQKWLSKCMNNDVDMVGENPILLNITK